MFNLYIIYIYIYIINIDEEEEDEDEEEEERETVIQETDFKLDEFLQRCDNSIIIE